MEVLRPLRSSVGIVTLPTATVAMVVVVMVLVATEVVATQITMLQATVLNPMGASSRAMVLPVTALAPLRLETLDTVAKVILVLETTNTKRPRTTTPRALRLGMRLRPTLILARVTLEIVELALRSTSQEMTTQSRPRQDQLSTRRFGARSELFIYESHVSLHL